MLGKTRCGRKWPHARQSLQLGSAGTEHAHLQTQHNVSRRPGRAGPSLLVVLTVGLAFSPSPQRRVCSSVRVLRPGAQASSVSTKDVNAPDACERFSSSCMIEVSNVIPEILICMHEHKRSSAVLVTSQLLTS